MQLLAGALLLAGSLVLNYFAGAYAEKVGQALGPSPDLILRHLPIVDGRVLYLWGCALFISAAILHALARERKRAGYIARVYALVIAAKSLTMLLTPMGIPQGFLEVHGHPFYDAVGRFFTVRHDLFFSGHTALPFVGFLVFRGRFVRAFFLAGSLLMAATVLLGRQHYAIDVAAAYFITYTLWRWEMKLSAVVSALQKRRAVDRPAAGGAQGIAGTHHDHARAGEELELV